MNDEQRKREDDDFYSAWPGMEKCTKCGEWYDTHVRYDPYHKCERERAEGPDKAKGES